MKKSVLFFIIITIYLGSPTLFAMERFDIVTTEQLKQMLDGRRLNKIDFLLVNSLDEMLFRNSSIPESINLPWSKVNELASRLGEDKNKLIVTY